MLSILRHSFRFQCFYLVYQAVILYHEIETSDYPPRFGLGDFNSKGNFTCFLFLCRKKPQENIKKVLGMSIEKREEFDHREINTVLDRKSTRLNSSHVSISYAVFCLKKKIQMTS